MYPSLQSGTILAMLVLSAWFSPAVHCSGQDMFRDAVQIHHQMCLTLPTPPPELDIRPCCGHCSNVERCEEYGICCLDHFDSFDSAQQATDMQSFHCVKPEHMMNSQPAFTTSFNRFDNIDRVWIRSRCSGDADDSDINTIRCTSPDIANPLDYLVPISDLNTNTTYKNRYCASCNGVNASNILNWDTELMCNGSLTMTDQQLFDRMKELNCSFFFYPPAGISVDECGRPGFSIAECNVTGLWPHYDEMIEKACHAFVDPFNKTYQNYFCYVCNTDQLVPPHDWYCQHIIRIVDEVMPSFVALINLEAVKKWQNEEYLRCNLFNQFPDEKKVQCRDLNCHEGLRVVSRERCEQMVKVEHILNCSLIELYTKLSPQDSNILSFISQHGFNFSNSLFEEAGIISIANMLKLQIFETEHYVKDYTEKVYIAVYWTMLVTHDYVWHGSLMDVLKIFHNADISVSVDGNYQTFRSEVVSPFFTSASDSMLWHSTDNITMIKDRLDPIAAIDHMDNSTENQCTRKAFSKLFVCPFIEIGLNEISFKQNETFLIIGDTDRPIVLADWQYVMTNGSLQVCVDDFQIISNSMHWHSIRDEVDHEIISTSQILSFACVCTSLFCLLVTIVTYAVTPEMRTQPGINNVILCVSLLLAQTVYQFGAAQTAYVSSFVCSFIGAICHFLWLCVIFSMNNCSIQMFRIFKRSVLVAPQFSWISTAKSILYITCMSLSFVVIAVTISLSLSNGRNSGYGGSICFLSDYLMHTVTFMIPTALIIVLNIVLFVYVVFVIYKSNEEAARLRQERSYFGVYVRLSTLTGLTWVFGYLYLFLKFDIIEYFFIVFNGLQGVFLMFAFTVKTKHCAKACQRLGALRNPAATTPRNKVSEEMAHECDTISDLS